MAIKDDGYILYDGEQVLVDPVANGYLIRAGTELDLGGKARVNYVAEDADRARFILGRLLTEDGWIADAALAYPEVDGSEEGDDEDS